MTLQTKRLDYLDSIRGIAALVVLLSHCWQATVPTLGGGLAVAFSSFENLVHYSLEKLFAGRAAVMIFFVLSGFVLSYSLQKHPLPYSGYAIKRIFRIYPTFLLAVLSSFAAHYFIGVPYQPDNEWLRTEVTNPDISPTALVKHLMMFGTPEGIRIDIVVWSLIHEMRISLLFPLILFYVRRVGWRSVWDFGILSLACTTLYHHVAGQSLNGIQEINFYGSMLATIYFIVFFAAGAWLSIERNRFETAIKNMNIWQMFCVITFVTVCLLKSGKSDMTDYINGVGAFGVIALALSVRNFQNLLVHRVPIWLGRISYSLYLVHVPILYVVTQTIGGGKLTLLTAVAVIGFSLLIAELMVRFIELPFMRLGKRLAA